MSCVLIFVAIARLTAEISGGGGIRPPPAMRCPKYPGPVRVKKKQKERGKETWKNECIYKFTKIA